MTVVLATEHWGWHSQLSLFDRITFHWGFLTFCQCNELVSDGEVSVCLISRIFWWIFFPKIKLVLFKVFNSFTLVSFFNAVNFVFHRVNFVKMLQKQDVDNLNDCSLLFYFFMLSSYFQVRSYHVYCSSYNQFFYFLMNLWVAFSFLHDQIRSFFYQYVIFVLL